MHQACKAIENSSKEERSLVRGNTGKKKNKQEILDG
jgi:hypothetical protein